MGFGILLICCKNGILQRQPSEFLGAAFNSDVKGASCSGSYGLQSTIHGPESSPAASRSAYSTFCCGVYLISILIQGGTISIRCQAQQAVVTVIVTMMAMAMEDMVIAMMVAMVIAMMMAMVTVMQANTGDVGVRLRKMFALSFWIL